MSVVISEDLWCSIPRWFEHRYSVVYDKNLYRNPDALKEHISSAQALIVRNQTQVNEELLSSSPKLRVIGRLGVGLDNIDTAACRAKNVTVVSARGCNAVAVAEYVFAAMFARARFLHDSNQQVRSGEWNRRLATGRELYGKTLGLVGAGDIGLRVASRARVLGMHVLVSDPLVSPAGFAAEDLGLELVSLPELLSRSDYISLHVPLTPETRHLISAEQLAMMKPEAVLINTARGAVVDEEALQRDLREHPRRFAILDVREQEPPTVDDLLKGLENVLLTPHVAGITEESSERVAEFVLSEVDLVLRGGRAHPYAAV